jgi:hypothetical protein
VLCCTAHNAITFFASATDHVTSQDVLSSSKAIQQLGIAYCRHPGNTKRVKMVQSSRSLAAAWLVVKVLASGDVPLVGGSRDPQSRHGQPFEGPTAAEKWVEAQIRGNLAAVVAGVNVSEFNP